MSESRINLPRVVPDAYRAISGVEPVIRGCGLEPSLIERVKLCASQINQCAHCINMHSQDVRRGGEREQRSHLLNARRETPLYSERERAALMWAEHLNRLPADDPGGRFEQLRTVFSEVEIANLTVLVGLINLWNRIGVGMHMSPTVAS